jgi:hypothetical protein
MTLKTELILISTLALLTFALGALTEHHYAKPVIQSVNVDHDVIHNNIVTVTHTIHEKDGTTDTTTTTMDHTQQVDTDTKTIAKPLPNWLVAGTYSTEIHTLQPAYGVQVNRRILGPMYIGAGLNSQGMVGLSLGFEF